MAERRRGSEMFSQYFVVYLSYKGSTTVVPFNFLKFVEWIGTEVLWQEMLNNLIMEKWL